MDRFAKLVAAGAGAHLLLFVLGYVFVGLQYTILLFILYGLTWICYCGAIAEKWDAAEGAYEDAVSVQALALIGGPLCWLLCPSCLLPAKLRAGTGFTLFWFGAQRLSREVCRSLLKTMDLLYGFCRKEFPEQQAGKDAGGDEA